MERTIEFRAWHTIGHKMFTAEEMAEDQLTLLPTGRFINVSGVSTKLSQIIEDMIPLQYTGLRDKAGKKIYEADILENVFRFVVTWDILRAKFYLKSTNDLDTQKWTMTHSRKMKIIGNIYENPDLLTKF